jgi:branched-chain amino acid transport system permease protein
MRPSFFGIDTMSNLAFYYFTLVVFLVAAFAFWWLVHSPWGRAFKALRENPVRADSLGVNIRLITLLAFAIGSAMGGLAGALAAPLVQFIDPPAFSLVHSLRLLLMVVVGGAGFYFGPILGAALVIVLPEFLRVTEEYYLMLYATAVLVLMIFCPTGIIGLLQRAAARWRGQRVRGDLQEGAQL